MIQRIQSLYLSLTILLSLLFLKGSFLSFINKSGAVVKHTFTSIIKSTEREGSELVDKVWPLTIILILVAILSLLTIFLYNKRSIQLCLSKILIGLVSGLILVSGYYSYVIITNYSGKLVPGVKMFLLLLMLILSILAFRGIMKDDKLVKSYDRLR